MARKPPRIEHVKHVKRGERWYSYFNTGQKNPNGRPIYKRLPPYETAGFWDSYASFKAGRTRRQVRDYTVASLIHDYQQSAAFAKLAANTRKLYDNQALKIDRIWGKFPVNELTPAIVRRALDVEKFNAGTHNMVLAVLGVVYRWGRRHGKAVIDPVKDIEREEGGTHEPWPEHILEVALAADDDVVRLAVHLLYFTGQRLGDVLKMRWTDIRGGRIYVVQEKTGKEVYPPISSELKAELDRTPRKGLFILEGQSDKPLRKRLQKFTAALGAKTVPHGLRKNAVNALLEAGCTIAEVASITGQTFQVVEHYAARVDTHKLGQAAIHKLEDARKRAGTK